MQSAVILALLATRVFAGGSEKPDALDVIKTDAGLLQIHPINHATFALQCGDKTVYVDPVGGSEPFAGLPRPNLILITDIHGDHLSKETITKLLGLETRIVAPPAVIEQFPEGMRARATSLGNGQGAKLLGLGIEAIPAYNLASDRQKFHPKGRGNGYVITFGGKRIYISGDTEDVPEMLALKNIDVAFVCMNLPYTMTVDQAARAVGAFKPKVVYPYHSRGSDLAKFKELVGADAAVDVRLRDWYPAQSPKK